MGARRAARGGVGRTKLAEREARGAGGIAGGLRLLEGRLLALLMLAMVALYGFNVGVRGLTPAFASQVAWIDEATRFALVWSVFLALGAALERGRHVAMTTLLERFPPRARAAIARLIDLAGLLFSLYIARLGMDITLFVLRSGQISPTLDISMAWLYAVVPVGFGLLALRYALALAGLAPRFGDGRGRGG